MVYYTIFFKSVFTKNDGSVFGSTMCVKETKLGGGREIQAKKLLFFQNKIPYWLWKNIQWKLIHH